MSFNSKLILTKYDATVEAKLLDIVRCIDPGGWDYIMWIVETTSEKTPRRFVGVYNIDHQGVGELQVDDHKNRKTTIWKVWEKAYV